MINKILIILSFLMLLSCDFGNELKIYKDALQPGFKGQISNIEYWKGGLLVIHLKAPDTNESIAELTNDYDILQQIKSGYYFEKKPNSNKCLVKTNDSIFYFDCVFLKKLKTEIADSLSVVEQWDRNIINKWMKIE
jgi:hypothetical protein